jgi:hypothetical protein
MHRKFALTAILAVALAVTSYAQKKDFSGTWTLDQAATDAAATTTTAPPPPPSGGGMPGGRMGRGMGAQGPLTIKQTADSLSIERAGRGGNPMTTTYKLDGSEQEVPMGQATAKVRAKWDGDTIVIETIRSGQDGTPMTMTATYSLDKDGVLWVETKGGMGTQKRAYKKSM